MRGSRRLALLMSLLVAIGTTLAAADTRYHQHCAKAKGSGGAVKPIAATYFGSTGAEELIAVGWAPNGDVVAVGNAWGPQFPTNPAPTVIGEDLFTAAPALSDPEKLRLDYSNPNTAAFVARYSATLDRLVSVTRLGWGNAMAGQALVASDGAVYLSGRCTPAGRASAQAFGLVTQVVTAPEGVEPSGGDLYLARLSPGGADLEWAIIFEGAEGWSRHWEGRMGDRDHVGIRVGERSDGSLALVAFDRLYALTADGATLEELGPTRGGVLLTVDRRDDSVYLGGDENTNTGREPWRRPFLTRYDRTGKLVWQGWRWDSKRVGLDQYRLVSDSGVYGISLAEEGDDLVWGWSDGGNSVFARQPTDLDQSVTMEGSFIDSLWGASVGKFSWLMKLDQDNDQVARGANWCAFLTSKNKPNSAIVKDAALLDDGRVAFVGGSSFAFVETPDAWVRTFPQGSGGTFFAILSSDLHDLLFGSLLPSCSGTITLAARDAQAAIAGQAGPPDEERPPRLDSAVQPAFGGTVDGYLMLVGTRPPHE